MASRQCPHRIACGLIFLYLSLSLVTCAELNLPITAISGWAKFFGKRMFSLTKDITKCHEFAVGDQTGVDIKQIDGAKTVETVAKRIETMLQAKVKAIEALVKEAENAYRTHAEAKKETAVSPTPSTEEGHSSGKEKPRVIPSNVPPSDTAFGVYSGVEYYNAKKLNEYNDDGTLKNGYLELQLEPLPHFNFVKVNINASTVHVPTNVFDRSEPVLDGVQWSEKLDKIFKENYDKDKTLTWQYFGSATGFFRIYPGVSWNVHEANYIDYYDGRTQDWYIQAATSPKDVVILMDVSGSMEGLRRKIAIETVKKILATLSDDDFFNVLAFNSSVNYLDTCFNGTLIQANADNKKRIEDKLAIPGYIQPGEMADWPNALSTAFTLLEQANTSRRLCNSAIMIITDGAPEHYEHVFRDYNQPVKHRVFTYLIGREVSDKRQVLWMACSNKGYYTHISTLADIEENIQKYIHVLSRPLVIIDKHDTIWTSVYFDAAYYVDVMARPLVLKSVHQTVYTKAYHSAMAHESKVIPRKYFRREPSRGHVPMELLEQEAPAIFDLKGEHFHVINKKRSMEGLRMMTSVAQPVFDTNSSVKGNTNSKELKKGNLLGVMGTDVPIKEITKLTPLYELGVNAYPFAITNNGYILFHPDFRPTLNGKEKPNYNSVDLSEVELEESYTDDYGFPHYDMKLRRDMIDVIDNDKATPKKLTMKVNIHYDNMTRVVQRQHDYFFIPIDNTPFSLGLAFPDHYGQYLFTAKAKKNQFEEEIFVNAKDVKDGLEVNKNWEDYCFLEFNQTLLDPAVVLVEYFKNDTLYNKCKDQGKDLILSMLWDAIATKDSATKWKGSKKPNDGVEMVFFGTRAGVTRYYVFDDVANTDWIKSQDKTIEELYYKRAVENTYSKANSENVVTFMVPQQYEVGNDTLLSIVAVIPVVIKIKKDDKDTPFGVVGFQMNYEKFKEIFYTEASKCKEGSNIAPCTNKVLTCKNATMKCYLLDENGFIIFSKTPSEIGKFFGEVDGALLFDLVDKKVYKRVTVYDYQGVCNIYDKVISGASSFVINPLKRLFSSFTWVIQEIALFIVQFNLLSWWNNRGAWAEEELTGVGPAPEGYYTADTKPCTLWAKLFKMQGGDLADNNENLTLFKQGTVMKPTMKMTWMAQRVTKTNLIFLVADGSLCIDCEQLSESLEPKEVKITNQTILCQKLQTSVHRKEPKECHSSHPQEDYKNYCGRGHTLFPSISLVVVLLLLGWTAAH